MKMKMNKFYNVFCTLGKDRYDDKPLTIFHMYMKNYEVFEVPSFPTEIGYYLNANMLNNYSLHVELNEKSEYGAIDISDGEESIFMCNGALIGTYTIRLEKDKALNFTILPPVSEIPKSHVDIGSLL